MCGEHPHADIKWICGGKKQFQKTKGSDNAIRIGYHKFGSLIFKNQQGNWKRI
ncbi:hypothetical protein QUF81_02890 [Peribacillus simplex]|uniref:Uncharacterized protein n=2 Tax=Peribacillus simplex TaxID=1478 RepID=A0AAW7IHM0_9BACI|nr:hypothetical protein [Peribacillus simplex]MDM5292191.1 hypothetical protein [Peribacillus simplex]MDM5451121.1 hypothetical protein [Peribacillus simplex]